MVKHAKEIPILLNYANLSIMFCLPLSEKIYFHFKLGPDPMEFKFFVNFNVSNF